MPFTFAHPAAVLPIRRLFPRAFVLSALVVGSMTPDFGYLMPEMLPRVATHSLAGSLRFCLPAGLLVYVAFHLVLKAPLAGLLPDRLRAAAAAEIARAPALPRRSPLVVLASLWIGALTHLVWDSFTHSGARGVNAFPALETVLFRLGGYPVPAFRVLQHVSTLVGFLAIALVLRGVARRAPSSPAAPGWARWSRRMRVVIAAGIVTVPVAMALAMMREDWRSARTMGDQHSALFFTVVTALGGFALAILIYALAWHGWSKARRSG